MENQCCLCGKKNGREIHNSEETQQVFACDDCAVDAITEMHSRGKKKTWYRTKRNWGFWILIIGFILFCITWFIVKPRLGV